MIIAAQSGYTVVELSFDNGVCAAIPENPVIAWYFDGNDDVMGSPITIEGVVQAMHLVVDPLGRVHNASFGDIYPSVGHAIEDLNRTSATKE